MLCHITKHFPTNVSTSEKIVKRRSALSYYCSIFISIVQCRGAEKLLYAYELSTGVASEFSVSNSIAKIYFSRSRLSFRGRQRGLHTTFVFAQWWAFEAACCPRDQNVERRYKLIAYTSPHHCANILLAAGALT